MEIFNSLASPVGVSPVVREGWPSLSNENFDVGDAELLELYCAAESRTALAAIIRRYAPLVASVVRRMLSNPQDSEDAFQATFLVLMVSAKRIRNRDSLAPWLYGVAYRTAKRIRQLRKKSTTKMINQSEIGLEPDSAIGETEEPLSIIARELQLEAMDEELSRLPPHLREPLIEHYLSGITVPEIAKVLNLSISAVEGRLKRGRRELRSRLAIRGISLSVVAAACIRFQQEVVSASAEPWTDRFLDTYCSSFDPTAALKTQLNGDPSDNTPLFQLIQGELTMKQISRPVLAGVLATLGIFAVGTFGVLNAVADQNDSTGRGARQRTSVVELRSSDVFESDANVSFDATAVLAQQKGNTPSPGGAGAAPATGSAGSGATGGSSGGGAGAGAGGAKGAGDGAAVASAKPEAPVKWTKPTEPPPYWLADETDAETVRSEERIRKALNARMEAEFNAQPLSQVVKFFADQTGVHFLLDSRAIEEEGLNAEEPVTYSSPERKTRDILTQILAPMNLVYTIEKETVLITSKNSEKGAIRYYDLSYILPDDGLLPDLVVLIQNTIGPDTWTNNGGSDTISFLGSMLIVRTCEENHCEIEKMLRSISKQMTENLKRGRNSPSLLFQQSGGGGFGGGGGGMM